MFEKFSFKKPEVQESVKVERYEPKTGEHHAWWHDSDRYQMDPSDNKTVKITDLDNKLALIQFINVYDRQDKVSYTGCFMKLDNGHWIPLRGECYKIRSTEGGNNAEARDEARNKVKEIFERVSQYTDLRS